MIRKKLPLLLLIAIVFPAACYAEANHSWDKLTEVIKIGKKVLVVRMDAAQVEGKLLSINTDSITVQMKGQPMVTQRAEVFRVRYADIRKRNTLLGLAAGAGTLAAIAAGTASESDRGIAGGLGALLGAGIGAAAGAVIPIGAPLYQAEESAVRAKRSASASNTR